MHVRTVNYWIDNTWMFVFVYVCLAICEHAMQQWYLGGKHCWETDFCIQHACVHKDMQTYAHTFLSSLHQQLHSSSHCSAAYQCFCFRQVWQWHFDQWLVHHPSPAHWKETVVHTLPTVKIIIYFDTINQLPLIRHPHTSTSVIQIRSAVNARTKQFLHYILK